ncbi:hypothetical protein Btru_035743 [Bulinus truncatus]|nr:hypothetical protein Btru_035743 [Bulinus truncatus]
MALEREVIGLIASSSVLIVLLAFALIVFALMCYRRLEKTKLSRLPKYGPSDVSAWASEVTTIPATDLDAEVGASNRIHGYRPKVLVYHKERSYRRQRHRPRKHSQDNDHQTIEGNRVVSVINVGGHSQSSPAHEISGNSRVVSGHIVTRSNGQYVYGHLSRAQEEEEALGMGHVIHESDGRVVHGYMVDENVDVTTGHSLTRDVQMTSIGNSYVSRASPRPAVAQDVFVRPEAARGHVIKQNVTVDQDGRLVVSGSRQIELDESGGFQVSHLDGPQIVHGHYSSAVEDKVTSHLVQSVQGTPVVATGQPYRSAAQSTTLTSLALEGMTATGVSVTVPEIVVSHCEDNDQADNSDHNHNSDDDEEYDRKRRENYKVIKKHSAYKIPEWIIKKVTEQDPNLDPETKDTVTQLEQRLSTGQEHRESISEIERRLSSFSATSSFTTSPAPTRSTAVTFGAVTHIQDNAAIGYDSDAETGDDPDLSRRSSSMSVPPWGDNSTLSSRVEADDVRSQTETLVSRDGSVLTKTTTVQRVTHVKDADHAPSSPFRTVGDPDLAAPGSTFSEISQQSLVARYQTESINRPTCLHNVVVMETL